MATPDITKAPPGLQAGVQLAGADVLSLTPHQPDGDFFNPVIEREHRESATFTEGSTELELFTMQNGRHYEVVTGIPKHQRSDYGIVMGTALATSVRGHNWHTMLKTMELGFPVTLVGPEGGHQRWPKNPAGMKRFVENLLSISIVEAAINTHEIMNELEKDENLVSEPSKAVRVDESRSAAIAIGFNALGDLFDRSVIYSDLIGAPFPVARPVELRPASLGRAAEIATQIGSLIRHSTPMGPRRGRHLLQTANPNPYFMLHAAATIPTLVSGQTGVLAKQIPVDSKVHHTHFIDDPWTDISDWIESSEKHPFVVHDVQPGDHGAIVRRDTQQDRLTRLENLRDELESTGQRPENIDWEHVYLSGQLAVAAV